MGRNFYTLDGKHIGKRCKGKDGQQFYWAMEPKEARRRRIIQSQGRYLSSKTFWRWVRKCEQMYDLIGKSFS